MRSVSPRPGTTRTWMRLRPSHRLALIPDSGILLSVQEKSVANQPEIVFRRPSVSFLFTYFCLFLTELREPTLMLMVVCNNVHKDRYENNIKKMKILITN